MRDDSNRRCLVGALSEAALETSGDCSGVVGSLVDIGMKENFIDERCRGRNDLSRLMYINDFGAKNFDDILMLLDKAIAMGYA